MFQHTCHSSLASDRHGSGKNRHCPELANEYKATKVALGVLHILGKYQRQLRG